MAFQEVDVESLSLNPFQKIGKQWMLVTAGTPERCNTMTASWGGLGVLWGHDVATAYIRPQRRTKEFVDANELFTLTFLPEELKAAHQVLGKVSGYDDPDKIAKTDLAPVEVAGATTFEQAELALVCRKLYAIELGPEHFLDTSCDARWYPEKDYHTMYVGAIEHALVQA